jgi:hypothetical protein
MLPHPVPDLATGPGKGQSMISIKVQIFVTIIRTATCLCVLSSLFFNCPDRSDSLRESWNDFPDYSDRSMMHGTIFLIILIVL